MSVVNEDGDIVNFVVEPTTYFVEHIKETPYYNVKVDQLRLHHIELLLCAAAKD